MSCQGRPNFFVNEKYRSFDNKIFMIKKVKKFNFWTKEEDKILLKLTENLKYNDWLKIAKNFENKNPVQCSARYLKIKPGIKKGHWTKEEDDFILENVKKFSTKWSRISKIMANRTGKQIRDRYLNYLDSNIKKDKFSIEEDKKIKELYIKYGSKWTKISKNIEMRTPEMIKNRFYSFLRSKIHVYEKRNHNIKRIRINTKRQNLKNNDHNKSIFFNELNLSKKTNQFKIVHTIDIFYDNNNKISEQLRICKEVNFSYIGSIKKVVLNNDYNSFTVTSKLSEININLNILDNYLENPFNLHRFVYFYLENWKNLLKTKYK